MEKYIYISALPIYFFLLTEATQDKSVRSPATATGASKPPRKFAGVVIITTGLPARGKSQVARCLARRLNWNGETAKGKVLTYIVFLLF